ncbi:unnamed protein product [Amoebophrya sp. A120]|nr:unnamed protein product [Amoebophrya sp. A120]|eukprot:GSA120T00015701001.1
MNSGAGPSPYAAFSAPRSRMLIGGATTPEIAAKAVAKNEAQKKHFKNKLGLFAQENPSRPLSIPELKRPRKALIVPDVKVGLAPSVKSPAKGGQNKVRGFGPKDFRPALMR